MRDKKYSTRGIIRRLAVISALLLLIGLIPTAAAEEIFDVPGTEIIETPDAEVTEDEPLFVAGNTSPLLSDSAEDKNYIVVEKRFIGLDEGLIPASFRITVSSDSAAYTLDRSNISGEREEDGEIIWRWKITGVGTGVYRVSESGENVENYYVKKRGDGVVEVRAADIKVHVPTHETTCSHTNWPVSVDGDSNVMFAATLTQGGVAVLSKYPLSASQRAAVSDAVLQIRGPWKKPVYFYSIEEQVQNGTGFELNGATITYDSAKEQVVIGRTKNWQHVATVVYSIEEADDPEIELVNSYARAAADVTVTKKVEGDFGDREKNFDFSVTVKLNGADADFLIDGTQYTGGARFSLCHGESAVLTNVPIGAEVSVTEDDYSQSGYAVSCSADGQVSAGRVAEITQVSADGSHVLFVNTKYAVPDTGVTLDSLPYVLLLGITAVSWVSLRRREKMR